MNFVLTQKEFDRKREEVLDKFDSFFKSYDEFSGKVSPPDWRLSGTYYQDFLKFKRDILDFKPLTKDQFQSYAKNFPDRMKDILTPEELELWNSISKYNL